MIEEGDLRFTQEEVQELKRLVDGDNESGNAARRLIERYNGHPALTSLIIKHRGLDEDEFPPRNLRWYADRLVEGLSAGALGVLYVSAMLQEDSVLNIGSCLPEPPLRHAWDELESLAPLLSLDHVPSDPECVVRVHAVLRDSVRVAAPRLLDTDYRESLRRNTLRHLRSRQAYARLLSCLRSECGEDEIEQWLSDLGPTLLRYAGHDAVQQVIERLSPQLLSGNPRLLLLRASVLREQERYDESRASALLAAEIAESVGDVQLRDSCLLLVAWLGVDSSRLDTVRHALRTLESSSRHGLDPDSERLVGLCSAIVKIQSGDTANVASHICDALKSVESANRLTSDYAVRSVNAIAGLAGVFCGDWATAACLMTNLAARPDLTPTRRILIRANLAVCHMEMGSLREAKDLLDGVIEDTNTAGLYHLAGHAYGTRSSVNYGLGAVDAGLRDFEQCDHLMGALEHEDVRLAELLYAAVNRRAVGLFEEALSLVEQAERILTHGTMIYLSPGELVSVEAAASFLGLGDSWMARQRASEVEARLRGSGALGHLLRADLILAEADRIDGAIEQAVARLAEHAEYVATGSANWLTAMYVRAFPGLLGLLADALGAAALPLRMLLMIPPDALDRAIEMAPYLSAEDAEVLRRRRGGEGQPIADELPPVETPSAPTHVCHARLFGGLEVMTDAGPVDEDSWRKRKARLLFLILLLRQHQDVPRDVLLERLWPEMDEDHAKRNFYVTWSTMKRALACGRPPSAAKTLVQCSGGVCRVTRQVRSDLDDFEEALAGLRAASAVNDAATVLACARRLVDIYRGELLPGDLYEEWFAEVRERTKHDFCDAMMMASNAAEAKGDAESALLFLRKASAADPWREDVYQSTMRCQMNAGQRSRAIETYLSCRSRLTEDLGIDPSIETTRIYQAVLAMDPGVDDVAAVSGATSG